MNGFMPEHGLKLWMSVDDGEEVLIGWARTRDDVPTLLRHVADSWNLRTTGGPDAGTVDGALFDVS